MALAGTVLGGRYELAEQIGNGGYCEVWGATDTVLSRPVAVKLLHPGFARKAEVLDRFEAEAQQAATLSHPNVARVYDFGQPADGQLPYLVMELVDGPCLEDVLAHGPLDARQSMDVIAQAAAGLQAAHDAGLIHRDIKPGNLLLASGGAVKITDFGIARAVGSAAVTPSGEMMGTPGYHAPEQVAGEQVTPASDLYALGVVAYECLAGAPPFTGTAVEMAMAHRDRPLPLLRRSVPGDVRVFVARLTDKDPARRPASAAEVARQAALLRDSPAVLRASPAVLRDGPALLLRDGPASLLHDGAAAGPGGRSGSAPVAHTEAMDAVVPRHPRTGRRRALAIAAVVLAGLTCLVLASLAGFDSVLRGVSVPAATPSGPSSSTVAPVKTARTPAIANPAASTPAATIPAATTPAASPRTSGAKATSTAPAAPRHGRGHGHGHGQDNGNGQGNGNG